MVEEKKQVKAKVKVKKDSSVEGCPLVPLRDTVMFPGMVAPIFVGRQKSIQAIEKAEANGQQIVFVAQKDSANDDPSVKIYIMLGL